MALLVRPFKARIIAAQYARADAVQAATIMPERQFKR